MKIEVGTKIIATKTNYPTAVPNGTIMTVVSDEGDGHVKATIDGGDGFGWFMDYGTYEPYVAPAADTPACEAHKLWRDMTPAEKGALLLAEHEGKVMQMWGCVGGWRDWDAPQFSGSCAYRIKPDPVVETVTLGGFEWNTTWYFKADSDARRTHRITFNLIDGKPDCASIRMEKL